MSTSSNFRLPGVYFLSPRRAAAPGLPRLDTAAFVGFTERGPLNVPVPVKDLNSYRAVFGGDLVLARECGGRAVYANLPTAVAAFFANGGQRCYVVRVAGEKATTTRFRIPGLISLDEKSAARSAEVRASSAGRWSARLRLGTRLVATPLPANAFSVIQSDRLMWQTGSAPKAIQEGDLLRLTLDDGQQWLFPVTAVQAPPDATPETPLTLVAGRTWQVITSMETSPPAATKGISRLTVDGAEPLAASVQFVADGKELTLKLIGDDVDKLQRGDVLLLEEDDQIGYLFPITTLRPVSTHASPPAQQTTLLTAQMMVRLPARLLPTTSPPPTLRRVERLRFDLALWEGEQKRATVSELSFNTGHPRYWGQVAALESSPLYRQSPADSQLSQEDQREKPKQEQWSERPDNGRLDIVADSGLLAPLQKREAKRIYLPLGMPTVIGARDPLGPDENAIGQDNLDTFSASPFLDPDLTQHRKGQGSPASALMSEAFQKRYVQNRLLRGMHSLLFVDEVALLAVPDATQRGWKLPKAVPEPSPPPPPHKPPPDWSKFMDCKAEEGGCTDTSSPALESQPSAVETWQPKEPILPELESLDEFDSEVLLQIQLAIIGFCQARKDVVGILTLPKHFQKRQCIQWQETLRQKLGLPRRRGMLTDARDVADLSYVSVYHPWLLMTDPLAPDGMREMPSDGAVCGAIAARERERQVWVAPANVALQGILGLASHLALDDWADLFDFQFNIIRQEARDLRVMSAHTLSDARSLLQLSVRRLMILLRKVALERGMDYVFENNDERFREGVRLSLEEMLQSMFERGAFAGATPQQSFRVVTDESVNTRQSVDQGRFIAQIQVAPSQPMEFITVLLTSISEGMLQATEV